MTPEARTAHIALIQAGRSARAERLDPAALAQYELRSTFVTGSSLPNDTEGWVDDCYHARFSAWELRQTRRSIITDAYTADEVAKLQAAHDDGPACYPGPQEDSDELRETLDTDDEWIIQAHRRYTTVLNRVEDVKRRGGPKMDDRLERLRGEWRIIEEETGVAWHSDDDWTTSVSEVLILTGREGQMRINRDAAEVSYCHRDPSDWQLDHKLPEVVLEQLAHKQRIAKMLNLDYTTEDLEQDRRELLIRHRRKQLAVAWQRLFAEYGEDARHGRVVTKWMRRDGRYIKPLRTENRNQFIERKIEKAGDELKGLQLSLDSMRFRLIAKRKRNERRIAA